jgi:hypothetical protein
MRKVAIDTYIRNSGGEFIEEQLELAYSVYYARKGSHKELQGNAVEHLAEAIAQDGNKDKAQILKAYGNEKKGTRLVN